MFMYKLLLSMCIWKFTMNYNVQKNNKLKLKNSVLVLVFQGE